MNMKDRGYVLFVFVAACLSVCSAQNATAKPESYEQEGFSFFYEHTTKTLLMKQGQTQSCYIWTLTNDELGMIHTDNGMRLVEFRVIKEIDNAVYTVLNGNILHTAITRYCSAFGKLHHVKYFVVH